MAAVNFRKSLRPVFLYLLLVLGSCGASEEKLHSLKIGSYVLKVEIARSPEERKTGLMGRKKLPENQGMLFVFDHEQKLSFWMKNTSIPLSIAYISKAGEIKGIHKMQPFSTRSVHSGRSVLYALEVNQGYFEKRNIKTGDFLELPALMP